MDDKVADEVIELLKTIRAELEDFFDHVVGRLDGMESRLDRIVAEDDRILADFIAARPHLQ